jgi:hydroxymethylpyrimidine/phosphomethylpyrimidine kinase
LIKVELVRSFYRATRRTLARHCVFRGLIMKRILIVAASDSGGGAGIQADVKAVTLLGGFAMTAITALTAQNTLRVAAVLPIPPKFVEQQIDVVMEDIGADAVKTGMLFSAETINAVA